MKEGLIFNIRNFSVHDGPGIRTTIFLKGCPLKCLWCHNPESQSFEIEKFNTEKKLEEEAIRVEETIGKFYSVSQVTQLVKKDRSFFDESGGGVTISGGEPLSQFEFLIDLIASLKSEGLHIALDTCGYAPWAKVEKTTHFTDLYLYDLKIINEKNHIVFTGKSNSLIINNLIKLSELEKPIHIRFPLVEGITDTNNNINDMVRFIGNLKSIHRIDILPYHSLAKSKSNRYYGKYILNDMPDYSNEKAKLIADQLTNYAPVVSIGG